MGELTLPKTSLPKDSPACCPATGHCSIVAHKARHTLSSASLSHLTSHPCSRVVWALFRFCSLHEPSRHRAFAHALPSDWTPFP